MVEKGQHVDRVHAARYIPSQLQWSLNYNVVLPSVFRSVVPDRFGNLSPFFFGRWVVDFEMSSFSKYFISIFYILFKKYFISALAMDRFKFDSF